MVALRRTFAGCLLGFTLWQQPITAQAAPLVWQVEGATDPTGQTPSQADRPQVPAGGPLVWQLDTTPEPAATAGLPGSTPPAAGPAAASAPPKANPDLQPDGYPRYGVPVDPTFPLPYIGGGMPSGYIAGWGSYYAGISGATPGKLRDGVVDGSINVGFGMGDLFKTVALQVDWGIGSVKNFGANGGFSISAGRLLVDQPRFQLAASGGVLSFYTYGNEGNPEPSTGYGVVTLATPLQPGRWDFSQTLQLSLGYGGYQFAYIDPESFESDANGFFTALGVQITKNVGLSSSWSPRGTNLNLSYTPFRDMPFYVNLLGADLFNVSPWGARAVLSITWGDDFRTALF